MEEGVKLRQCKRCFPVNGGKTLLQIHRSCGKLCITDLAYPREDHVMKTTKEIEKRIDEMLSEMTIVEKVGQMQQISYESFRKTRKTGEYRLY